MTREELYKEAMEAFKNPDTRLSKNLKMHRDRYLLRNKDRLTEKNNKDLDKLKVKPKLEGDYPELSKEQLDKLKVKPKLEGSYPTLSEEELDKLKQYSKGGAANSRIKTADYRKGGMVLSTVDNRKNK